MACLDSLPEELLAGIVSSLTAPGLQTSESTQALVSLCLVNHRLNRIATPSLYRSIRRHFPGLGVSNEKIQKLSRTIKKEPALAKYIRAAAVSDHFSTRTSLAEMMSQFEKNQVDLKTLAIQTSWVHQAQGFFPTNSLQRFSKPIVNVEHLAIQSLHVSGGEVYSAAGPAEVRPPMADSLKMLELETDGPEFGPLFYDYPNLEGVRIACSQHDLFDVGLFLAFGPSLKHLQLAIHGYDYGTERLWRSTLGAIKKSVATLESLSLATPLTRQPESYMSVGDFNAFSRLRHLRVTHDAVWTTFAQNSAEQHNLYDEDGSLVLDDIERPRYKSDHRVSWLHWLPASIVTVTVLSQARPWRSRFTKPNPVTRSCRSRVQILSGTFMSEVKMLPNLTDVNLDHVRFMGDIVPETKDPYISTLNEIAALWRREGVNVHFGLSEDNQSLPNVFPDYGWIHPLEEGEMLYQDCLRFQRERAQSPTRVHS